MIELLTLGEVLWDLFPGNKLLGGAPFNLCFHAKQLGVEAASITRVGADELGEEILQGADKLSLPLEFIQKDDELPTGTVHVELDSAGKPTFTITEDVAWDAIELSGNIENILPTVKAIAFGSLAQRSEKSRTTIRTILEKSNAPYKLCDINLRKPFFSEAVITYSAQAATILKLNDEEIVVFQDMFNLSGSETGILAALKDRFDLEIICITKGSDGCTVFFDGKRYDVPGEKVIVADTVGSGDAFSAAFLVTLLNGGTPVEAAEFANKAGALVASKPGGTPEITKEEIQQLGL